MIAGILAGMTWSLETLVIGLALAMSQFVSTEQVIFLAPFVSTFIHDAFLQFGHVLIMGLKVI